MGSDMVVDSATGEVTYNRRNLEDWQVTLVDTGQNSMTGSPRQAGRRAPAGTPTSSSARTATAWPTSTSPSWSRSTARTAGWRRSPACTRLRASASWRSTATSFTASPRSRSTAAAAISGGFFVFDTSVLDRIDGDPSCILEREPLGGPGPRRRAVPSTGMTASGSAPTPCATSSTCAHCGTAARRPGACGTTGIAAEPDVGLRTAGWRDRHAPPQPTPPGDWCWRPRWRRHLPHRQLALAGRHRHRAVPEGHARSRRTARRHARRPLPALQGPRRLGLLQRARTGGRARPASRCWTATAATAGRWPATPSAATPASRSPAARSGTARRSPSGWRSPTARTAATGAPSA